MSDRYTRLCAAISAMISAYELRCAIFTSEARKDKSLDDEREAGFPIYEQLMSDIFRCLLEDFADMTPVTENSDCARQNVSEIFKHPLPDMSIKNLRTKDDYMVAVIVARNLALTYNIRNPYWSQFSERYRSLLNMHVAQ